MTTMQIVLTDNLQAIIDEFQGQHPEWESQKEAYHECEFATSLFIEWVSNHYPGWFVTSYSFECDDVANPDPLVFDLGKNESGDTKSRYHCIAEMQDCYVDWTARQYKADIPYPYVIPKVAPLASTTEEPNAQSNRHSERPKLTGT